MAFAILDDLVDRQEIQLNYETAEKNYVKAICKGLFKIMSKMGISTIRSYRGAKLFEAIGLSRDLADTYFGGTTSNIGGIRLEEIAADAIAMHNDTFSHPTDSLLEHKGIYSFRKDGEKHAWNPDTISMLQLATRLGSYKKFKEYSHVVDEKESPIFLRDFLTFKQRTPIPLEQVEPEEDDHAPLCHGSDELRLYQPGSARDDSYSHEQIHGRSNTGEGGEARLVSSPVRTGYRSAPPSSKWPPDALA